MPKTATHKGGEVYLGDKKLTTFAKENSFSHLIFYALSGEEPTVDELSLFDLILSLSIDHGPDTPSAVETIKATKEGKTISESVAAGVTQINDSHGGAIGPAMELFYKIDKENLDIEKVVKDYLSEGKRIPGFGHRIYELDPRAELIMEELSKLPSSEVYIRIAREIEKVLEVQKKRKLPLNIDGAIAAALCTFEWESNLGKPVFLIARLPGLAVHTLKSKES